MYFDGQLHYLEKDRQPALPPKQSSHPRATSADANMTSTPAPSTTSTPTMPKSQTVGGAAGDLHSMALKSAISNIGMLV